jgi:polysaccharide deacetylase family protein (PEP-CTERM system associated)
MNKKPFFNHPPTGYVVRVSDRRSNSPVVQSHILTVDVEDWYLAHREFFADSPVPMDAPPDQSVVDAVSKTIALLAETGNTATFFVLGSVAEHYPAVVRKILDEGHEVASHGYLHRRLIHLTPDEFKADLRRSLDALAGAGADEVKGYRAPCFSITKVTLWALDILRECGLKYDSSIFPVRRKLYGIPDWPRGAALLENGLMEFPPATVRGLGINLPVAGGGYLRMLPYALFAKGVHARSLSSPAVFYFHPYELDPRTVVLRHWPGRLYSRAVTRLERMGLAKSPEKIRRLLHEFRFTRLDRYLP